MNRPTEQFPWLLPWFISIHNFPRGPSVFLMLPVLYTFSVVVSLTTVRWAQGPVVRRPREETGAGPAALSGPVRYPDRKQLEAAAAAAEHKTVESCELRPSHTETRPDIRLNVCSCSERTQEWMLVYSVWGRRAPQVGAGTFRPVWRSDADSTCAKTKNLIRWIEYTFITQSNLRWILNTSQNNLFFNSG